MENAYPRVYVTNRLSKKALAEAFGPFPSRSAADRYCDAVLDLFQIRRCHEELEPYPEHPGCVYGEMKKCMAPCKAGAMQSCTREELDARYAEEAQRIFSFLTTRGRSMLDEIASQREAASEAMDFEQAAALHKQWERVRAASLLADELVRPASALRALVIQEAAPNEDEGVQDAAAVFLLAHGRIAGPETLSTLGVRAVREQTAVGSSLFAQPLMLAAIPEESGPEEAAETPATLTPEDRARAVIAALEAQTQSMPEIAELCDYLSLFRRWYYRPEKQRTGEVLLPNAEEAWSLRRLLNAAARVVLGRPTLAPPVDREAAKGLQQVSSSPPKRKRSRKSVTPADLAK
jgi:hypothetical protein